MVKSDVVVHYLVYARQYHFKRISNKNKPNVTT